VLVSPDGVAPSGWSVCLPLLIFLCTIKSRSSLLAAAHPGGPRKRAVKWLWIAVFYVDAAYYYRWSRHGPSVGRSVTIASSAEVAETI